MAAGIHVFSTEEEVLQNLADYFVSIAVEAIAEKGRFSIALSGGSSPKKLYELLSSAAYKTKVDWKKVFFFFGDERYVPDTHPDSNYGMAKNALLDPLQIMATNVFAVDTSLPPEEAATKYTETIQQFFSGSLEQFDLVLLGLGDNAHTASLFPHTPILHDTTASVKAVFLPQQQLYRISFTALLINHARQIAFLVYGKAKATALKNVLQGKKDMEEFPAQLIVPVHGTLDWFIDAAAASALTS